ncbi:agamous-like MADS-box protein AGL80 [Vicia villosa]|uniref:agamous-like MADS-box protein AGL80 n=1 Tax=Vicia villosa TaxID=3911 RepID=UPI00273AE0AE|nr:agamous-like MADS-box protein AGL80 [Vicia villosa]
MGRRKVKLAFIVNDAARKAAYKNRKKGLLKKVDELCILCGIEACAIICCPYDPEIWPTPLGVQKVLSKFRTVPEFEKSQKTMNLEIFLKQRVSNAKEKLKKQMRENKEKEMMMVMFQCLNAGNVVDNNMSGVDLNSLASFIDHNLNDIGRRLETDNINNWEIQMNNFDNIERESNVDFKHDNDENLENEFWSNLQP